MKTPLFAQEQLTEMQARTHVRIALVTVYHARQGIIAVRVKLDGT